MLGLLSFYQIIFAFWKNYQLENNRTTLPYDNRNNLMFLFAWTYDRQPKDPFIYKPDENNARDYEKFIKYKENKMRILWKLQEKIDLTVRSFRCRNSLCSDHKELDFTDYQMLQQINFCKFSINLMTKTINEQNISNGLKLDPNLYIIERLNYDYKISEYKYKEELYKELKSLINI